MGGGGGNNHDHPTITRMEIPIARRVFWSIILLNRLNHLDLTQPDRRIVPTTKNQVVQKEPHQIRLREEGGILICGSVSIESLARDQSAGKLPRHTENSWDKIDRRGEAMEK